MTTKEYLQSYEKLLKRAIKGEGNIFECLYRKLDIENLIVDLEDGEESDVIRKKYIELKIWDEICEELQVSWAQVHRIHRKALENIELNISNQNQVR